MTTSYHNPQASVSDATLNITPAMIDGFVADHPDLLARMPEAVPTEDCAIYSSLPTISRSNGRKRERMLDNHLLSLLNK